eukprot:TRINITY_DN5730_c0_g1_i2.p1 TRINITY_DN5730_c0_g1~~TRINITY_DN5730_c0_g1_i2.p1  ORF type:complete len:354 (+),score=72.22 TRINITY_DN5730_c0_g1_i2:31-1092(+)
MSTTTFAPTAEQKDVRILELGPYRFRVNPSVQVPGRTDFTASRVEIADMDEDDIVFDDEKEIFSARVLAPPEVFGFLIGKGGKIRAKLQSETNAKLTIPKPGSKKSEPILITGPSAAAVSSMRTRVHVLIDHAIRTLPPTHFISVSLATEPWLSRGGSLLSEFASLASALSVTGWHPSLLVNPASLHITLFVLKLYTEEQLEQATHVLTRAAPLVYDAVKTRSVVLEVKGLAVMDPTEAAAHVLYADVVKDENTSRLAAAHDVLVREFQKAQLVDEQRPLKLHVTLANTRHRHEVGASHDERIPFDATPLLRAHKDVSLGAGRVADIRLCAMKRNADALSTDWYQSVARIPLP